MHSHLAVVAVRLSLMALALSLSPRSVDAHAGGIPVRPSFLEPMGIVEPTDGEVEFRWLDGDDDPTGIHRFYYQKTHAPPISVPEETLLQGVHMTDALVIDSANTFLWEVTDIPAGTWQVYTLTEDPPFCSRIQFAPALVAIRDADGTAPFGGVITQPGPSGAVVDQEATLEVEAISRTKPTIRLVAGLLEPVEESDSASPCLGLRYRAGSDHLIVEALEMEAHPDAGDERWVVTVSWDTSDIPAESYVVQAEISADGQTPATVYAPSWLAIVHGEQQASTPDESPSQACQTGTHAHGSNQWFWWLSILCFPCIRRAHTRLKGALQTHG
jgi:hypothetical protein